MQKESERAPERKHHSASVFLARRCFFRSRRRSRDSPLSLSVRQRARDTAPFTHARGCFRLLSLAARDNDTPYGKSILEKGNRRAHSRRPPAVRGGREIASEISTL